MSISGPDYVQENKTRIDELVDRAEKANACACEAETPAKLRLRLAQEGWEELNDLPGYYLTAAPPIPDIVLAAIEMMRTIDPALADTQLAKIRADQPRSQSDELLVVRGRFAYSVLDKHVRLGG